MHDIMQQNKKIRERHAGETQASNIQNILVIRLWAQRYLQANGHTDIDR